MKNTSFLYPTTPSNVSPGITEPSAAFKKEVSGVLGSIVFFFIVYLLLLLLSIGMVVGCVYAGFAIIVNVPRIITIIAGLGLIGVGVMVFVFLVKFMFAVSRYDRSGIVEITEEDQPALFAFIHKLAEDTQTSYPKRIYLSGDVNACVFYDSSFWSMFFPVKKNLQIGIGLVNAINLSEFKAVMAHEFGHFSQRSMKLGSFVYNVNKIVHNMLFENQGYSKFLQGWANLDGIFAFFAGITVRIAQGIQWILGQMYGLINKSYMRLSREMEFHADAVAASVSGSKSLVSALRRIEMAQSAYNFTLEKCDELYRQNKLSNNIFPNQSAVMLRMADQYKISVQNGLPVIPDEFTNQAGYERVNYKDQWASHPNTDDREQHLNKLAVEAEEIQESAWVLFQQRHEIEESLTNKIFEHVTRTADLVTIGAKEFEERLLHDVNRFSYPEVYNGFYDNRDIAIPDPVIDTPVATTRNFDELFSIENSSINKRLMATALDIEILKAIDENRIDTKTFDFDGVKFNRSESKEIVAQLEQEMKEMKASLDQWDKEAIQYFYNKDESLKQDYAHYFEQRRNADRFLNVITEMMESLHPLYTNNNTLEQVNHLINNLKEKYEPRFKKKLTHWRDTGVFDKEIELKKRIDKFIQGSYSYFNGTSFFDNELLELNNICKESYIVVSESLTTQFKEILVKQLPYAEEVNNPVRVSNDLLVP